MPDTAPTSVPWLAWVRVPFRLALGVFVLAQMIFMPLYNLVDGASTIRDHLKDQKKQDTALWRRVISTPLLGEPFEQWIEKDKESRVSKAIKKLSGPLEAYAQITGQEQGWGLFSPDTYDWTCFVSVEFRWDDDLEPLSQSDEGLAVVAATGGASLRLRDGLTPTRRPDPVIFHSENEPPDHSHYFRVGRFRLRRFDSVLETRLAYDGRTPAVARRAWEDRVRDKVDEDRNRIILYLRWRLQKFQEQHPDLARPTQVILCTRSWEIPNPYRPEDEHGNKSSERLPSPWAWIPNNPEPVPMVRWRPARRPGRSNADLEVYLHTEGRFEDKPVIPWLK